MREHEGRQDRFRGRLVKGAALLRPEMPSIGRSCPAPPLDPAEVARCRPRGVGGLTPPPIPRRACGAARAPACRRLTADARDGTLASIHADRSARRPPRCRGKGNRSRLRPGPWRNGRRGALKTPSGATQVSVRTRLAPSPHRLRPGPRHTGTGWDEATAGAPRSVGTPLADAWTPDRQLGRDGGSTLMPSMGLRPAKPSSSPCQCVTAGSPNCQQRKIGSPSSSA